VKKIRVVIADGEPLARKGIRQLLARHQDFTVIAETGDGRKTVRIVRELKPELLLLDVQLPLLDGFGVLHEIGPQQMPLVIFVTAHDRFAVLAFAAQALDYLVKPLKESRFVQALERVRKSIQSANAVVLSRQLAAVLAARKQDRPKQRVFVPRSSGDDLVLDADEINWIEAQNYYAAIHARGGRHLIRESLSKLEQRLDRTQFVRAHRSAIVNIDRVRKLRKQAGETILVLSDGVTVPISRRRHEHVMRLVRSPRS
jgi:two-component system, LytTR family, response regulator